MSTNIRYYDGDRIYFRPVEIEDAPTLSGWINEPANWATLGRTWPMALHQERDWVEKTTASEHDVSVVIMLRRSTKAIGATGLHSVNWLNRSAEFGIVIGSVKHQGEGYGTEAAQLMVRYGFDELNLNRIWLRVFADHDRAVRSYERVGFVQEGRERQSFFRGGGYHDTLLYGLLREDWTASAARLD